MKTKFKNLLGLSAFLFAAGAGGFSPTYAYADAVPCSAFLLTVPMVCGDALVQGISTDHLVASPDPVFHEQGGGPVAAGAIGAGPGGISGTALATGTFGEAHISVSADNGQYKFGSGFNGVQANVHAEGIIGFVDAFTISSGVFNVHITSSLDGFFTGDGGGGASLDLRNTTTNQSFISGGVNFVNFQHPSDTASWDLSLTAGDYTVAWLLDVVATSANGFDDASVRPSSTADLSNTGRLFFDSSDGPLTFLSGHNYSSGAAESATPLPAALPLFASGLGALGLLGWRRKRKNAAIAA